MAWFEAAMLGGAIGTAIPGFGNVAGMVIGGLLGGALDLYNFFTGAGAAATQSAANAAAIQAQQTALTASLLQQEAALSGQQAQLTITKGEIQHQLDEAQENASAYQTFLSKIPTAGETLTAAGTGDLEFDRQYRSLLGNLGNLNVLAGATGNVGPGTSMALVQEQGKADVGSFVEVTRDVKQRQLDIFAATAGMLTDALTTIGQTQQDLAESQAELEVLQNAPQPALPPPDTTTTIGNWWNDPNNWLNPANWEFRWPFT